MTIEFHCPHCEKFLRTSDDKAGRTAKCPGCGEPVTVPDAPGNEPVEDYDLGTEAAGEEYEDYGAPPPVPTGNIVCPMCGGENSRTATRCRHCGEPLEAAPPSRGRGRRSGVVYAGFWLRFVASFIDGLLALATVFLTACLLGCVLGLVMAASGAANGRPRDPQALGNVLGAVAWLVGIIALWPYFALMESSERQATLGKMAVGIIVTDLDGNRVTFGQATGRFFAKIISYLTCLIGYLMAGFTERKQALHDLIAGTLVIRA